MITSANWVSKDKTQRTGSVSDQEPCRTRNRLGPGTGSISDQEPSRTRNRFRLGPGTVSDQEPSRTRNRLGPGTGSVSDLEPVPCRTRNRFRVASALWDERASVSRKDGRLRPDRAGCRKCQSGSAAGVMMWFVEVRMRTQVDPGLSENDEFNGTSDRGTDGTEKLDPTRDEDNRWG
uniref:Uncharacterized protein n=1 Tax=Poecilia latipinna TaxID=48699 RepID=A0A3B3V5F8_9TELE